MRIRIHAILALAATAALVGGALVAPGAAAAGPSVADHPARPWTYLAMGDSHVYGPAEVCGNCTGYPILLKSQIPAATGHPIRLLNASQWNHLDAAKLLDEIRSNNWGGSQNEDPWSRLPDARPKPRKAIAQADIITIQVGFNDLPWLQWVDPCDANYGRACRKAVIPPYLDNLERILRHVDRLREGKPTAIRVANVFNDVIPGGFDNTIYYSPEVLAQGLTKVRRFVKQMNRGICAAAERHGAKCLDLASLFNGPQGLQPVADGIFTPDFGDINQPGQDLIAEEILDLGFRPLTHRHGCRHD